MQKYIYSFSQYEANLINQMHLAAVQLQITQLHYKRKCADPIDELTNEEGTLLLPGSHVINYVCNIRNKAIFFGCFLVFSRLF